MRIVIIPFALVLLVVGLILTPTPLPIGIPMVAVAVFLLIGSSPPALRLLRRARRPPGRVAYSRPASRRASGGGAIRVRGAWPSKVA